MLLNEWEPFCAVLLYLLVTASPTAPEPWWFEQLETFRIIYTSACSCQQPFSRFPISEFLRTSVATYYVVQCYIDCNVTKIMIIFFFVSQVFCASVLWVIGEVCWKPFGSMVVQGKGKYSSASRVSWHIEVAIYCNIDSWTGGSYILDIQCYFKRKLFCFRSCCGSFSDVSLFRIFDKVLKKLLSPILLYLVYLVRIGW